MIQKARAARRDAWALSLDLRASTFILLIALTCAACGKVGAPVPPVRLTQRTTQLAAVQRGADILLTWPAPVLVSDQASTSYVARADIYRLSERRDEEPVLDPADFEELAEVIGTLDRPTIDSQIKAFGRLQFTDALDLSRAADLANTRVRYAVRYANRRGQAAAFSNTVALEPAPGISLPPGRPSVDRESQDAVAISWPVPEADVTGSRPASVVGYNLYRRTGRKKQPAEPLNSEPLSEPRFSDTKFQYGADYIYVARALSQGANGLIESADSEPLAFTPIDRFAPGAPDPVSIASANGVISLFWPTSPERDVIGYNIYRSLSADAPAEGWTKLNAQPLSPVTFRDDRVVLDTRYFYRVTAVDRFDNESEPSKVVSETANP
ncbi:MAG TPA: fibronectin type III domain-containing protein [Blastocatellia bacterium]|nr:fibronectin type III domain-containing protein [Blastocatellia bacterium]